MTPAQVRKWRFYAEALIQQAIDIVDAIDGDADLEEGGMVPLAFCREQSNQMPANKRLTPIKQVIEAINFTKALWKEGDGQCPVRSE
jgi:hypothetical protein